MLKYFLIILLSVFRLQNSEIEISGKVCERVTSKPINNAIIEIKSKIKIMTNDKGSFNFTIQSDNLSDTICIHKEGYEMQKVVAKELLNTENYIFLKKLSQ